jgi:hypothetical protein
MRAPATVPEAVNVTTTTALTGPESWLRAESLMTGSTARPRTRASSTPPSGRSGGVGEGVGGAVGAGATVAATAGAWIAGARAGGV